MSKSKRQQQSSPEPELNRLLRQLGKFVDKNSYKLVFCLTIALITLCTAIKSIKFDSDINNWIERNSVIDEELRYVRANLGENSGSTSQLIIQTPLNANANILDVKSLMIHLEAMAIATHVTVEMFDLTWSLKDLCYVPSLPDFEGPHVSMLLENLIPCAIKTPLDCFWEGSKLLGPDAAVSLSALGLKPRWTSLNPLLLLKTMKIAQPHSSFPFQAITDWMSRVGITTGYQFKPCLDPSDPNCPLTSPNKLSKASPDIGVELTGGCYGVATREMHWLEDEIVGGIVKNKTGHIVKAKAFQSTIQLMGEQEMYEFWRKDYRINDINNWSVEKSKQILVAWQNRFKDELEQFRNNSPIASNHDIHAIASDSMFGALNVKSLHDLVNSELCFIVMTVFTIIALSQFEWFNVNRSTQNAKPKCDTLKISNKNFSRKLRLMLLAIIFSCYIGLEFIASLGISSLCDISINAATAQLLPPLALFYGFNQMFIVINSFSIRWSETSIETLCSQSLSDFGPGLILELFSYSTILLATNIIPINAMKVFALQLIIFMSISTLSCLILLPSIIMIFINHNYARNKVYPSLSCRVKKSQRNLNDMIKDISASDSDDKLFSRIQNDLKNVHIDSPDMSETSKNFKFSARLESDGVCTTVNIASMPFNRNILAPPPSYEQSDCINRTELLPYPVHQYSSHNNTSDLAFLQKTESNTYCDKNINSTINTNTDTTDDTGSIENASHNIWQKVFMISSTYRLVILLVTIAFVIYSSSLIAQVEFGLEFKDIVNHGSREYKSLSVQQRYFPLYNVFAVTKGPFDYPSNQRLLYEYHEKLANLEFFVSTKDQKSKFWLESFRDWLTELQKRFDHEKEQSLISIDGWKPEASDMAKLAYKLLAQTGRSDNPIDKSQVETARLVDSNGIINQKAFYYYLTAWVMTEPFSYSTSGACFKPEPKHWQDNPEDLRIERAKPIVFAQIPFLMKMSHDHHKSIEEIRSVTNAFEKLNLPNFPTGIPFIFWEQFSHANVMLITTLSLSLILVFLIIKIITMSLKVAFIIILIAVCELASLYGLLGLLAIPFNNILSVMFVFSLGINLSNLIHVFMSYLRIDGNTIERITLTFKMMFGSNLKTLLLLIMIVISFRISQFDFIVRYSMMVSCTIALNFFTLLVLPTILSISNIKTQYHTIDSKRELSNSPKLSACIKTSFGQNDSKSSSRKKKVEPELGSGMSLSTIPEESPSDAQNHDIKLDLSIKCYK